MQTNASFAGIPFSAHFSHRPLEKMLGGYPAAEPPLFSIQVTQEMIDDERRSADGVFSDGYLETLAFYRAFSTKAAAYGVILFHSCAVVAEGRAYLFAAPSGTGKSTHARLWLETFGARVRVLNGDKPLLRVVDGVPTVYGTPFMGKENMGYNGSAPIGGILFLGRGAENAICPLTSQEALPQALAQLYIPEDGANAEKILETQFQILNSVPLWRMKCNISREAAQLSYNTLTGGK